jgi:hypothetical protein
VKEFGLGIKDEKRHLKKECYVKASSQDEKRPEGRMLRYDPSSTR